MSICSCAGCFTPTSDRLCGRCQKAGCAHHAEGMHAIYDGDACIARRKVAGPKLPAKKKPEAVNA